MAALKSYLSYLFLAFLFPILLLMLYLLVAIILGITPVNRGYLPPEEGIEIFVASNGLHTDFVVPVRTTQQDWTAKVPLDHFEGADTTARYISFGWGDKAFYIETPTWEDLTVTRALKSLFWPTAAAMHSEYFAGEPRVYQWQERLLITEEQYARLIAYVEKHFQQGPDGKYLLIEGAGYAGADNFYEAQGKYHVINTSNSWTNRGLKKIGVRAAVWSPFDRAIRYQLRKARERAGQTRK
jgi:uncharacterized protein (TIGR02117 family)